MNITGNSHQGMVRSSNQDSYAYGEFSENACWALVCDGMGGVNGGNIASRTAVDTVAESFDRNYREEMSENSIKNLMQSAFARANYLVLAKAEADENLAGMGTTAVAAIVVGEKAFIAHIGDSRAYIIGEDGISQITKDHSIVQMMIDNGQITPEQAKEHPRRHIITRAIGVEENVDSEYDEVELGCDDILLLCSDGLTNYAEDSDIYSIVRQGDFEGIADRLIEFANQSGGGDNITVVAVSRNS